MSCCPNCKCAVTEGRMASSSLSLPTFEEVVTMLYAEKRKREDTEMKLETLEAEVKELKRSVVVVSRTEEEPIPKTMPRLTEEDMLDYLKDGIETVIDRYRWPVKARGKSTLMINEDGKWTVMDDEKLGAVTDYLSSQLKELFNAHWQRTGMGIDASSGFEVHCAKIWGLENPKVRKAFLLTK